MASAVPARPPIAANSHSATALLDRAPEPDFDSLAAVAAQICATPIATIAFLGADGWWLKSRIGLGADDTSNVEVFLAPTVAANDLLEVSDAARFYAGVPIVGRDGRPVGVLSVMGPTARALDPAERAGLRALSGQVVSLLELKTELAARERVSDLF